MSGTATLHIVYATPLPSVPDKLFMHVFKRRLSHPTWDRHRWPNPINAPLSITYHLAKHFSAHYRIRIYDLREKLSIEAAEGDILLGHMWPDRSSAMWRALENRKFARKYIISPYNHEPKNILWFREAVERCDKYFAICGNHWMDTFERSPFRDLAGKIVHLNMALDVRDYPVVKETFNPPGRRRFFYIGRYGRSGDEKGIRLLERLAETVPDFPGGYICQGGTISGWKKISRPTRLTPALMRKIATSYDCFINMSRADAQATTVLEAMSWGFPVACTPESGYSRDNLFSLDVGNDQRNLETIRTIQHMADHQLRDIARRNRSLVETVYGWDRFLKTLEKHL